METQTESNLQSLKNEETYISRNETSQPQA